MRQNLIKKISGFCIVASLSISPIASMQNVLAESYPTIGIVTTSSNGKVIIRQSPDSSSKSVKTVESGTSLNVVGKSGDWYQVSTSSFSGYINSVYIVLTGEKVEAVINNIEILTKEGNFPMWGYISTASQNLRLRQSPSINAKVMGSMPKGSTITILSGEYTLEHVNNKTYAWYNIQYGGYVGYACLSESGTGYDYITITGSTTITEVQDKTSTGWVRTNGSNLYVRQTPEYTNNKLGTFANGTQISITGNAVNGFYKVTGRMTNGVTCTGYVCADYVTFNKPGTLSTSNSTATGSTILNVVSYKQYNYPYDTVGNSSKTIKSVGCFVTSMAMVHTYNTDTSYTPVTIQKKLSFTGASFYHDSVRKLGYTMVTSGTNASFMQTAYNSLKKGRPAIVCIASGSSTHYVTITGFDGNPNDIKAYNFLINDPGSSTNSRLSQALAKKPTIKQIIY